MSRCASSIFGANDATTSSVWAIFFFLAATAAS
jgi:hypothetical protein